MADAIGRLAIIRRDTCSPPAYGISLRDDI
jgi:hypothetical protein